jgi:hypothetical protein
LRACGPQLEDKPAAGVLPACISLRAQRRVAHAIVETHRHLRSQTRPADRPNGHQPVSLEQIRAVITETTKTNPAHPKVCNKGQLK